MKEIADDVGVSNIMKHNYKDEGKVDQKDYDRLKDNPAFSPPKKK